jgi:hypothetical protein
MRVDELANIPLAYPTHAAPHSPRSARHNGSILASAGERIRQPFKGGCNEYARRPRYPVATGYRGLDIPVIR